MTDKRQSDRIKKKIKSEVVSEEHITLSSTVDLSKGGIFISTPEPLSNGSEVNMTIQVPGHGELEVQGVVRWVRSNETDSEKVGMGIEFTNINNELKKKLEEIVK